MPGLFKGESHGQNAVEDGGHLSAGEGTGGIQTARVVALDDARLHQSADGPLSVRGDVPKIGRASWRERVLPPVYLWVVAG